MDRTWIYDVCTYQFMCVYVCVFVCMCVYVCVFVCVCGYLMLKAGTLHHNALRQAQLIARSSRPVLSMDPMICHDFP